MAAAIVAAALAPPAHAQQPGQAAQARTNVAVFNFQMTSATPGWAWLEKGLADQITTHFVADGRLQVLARDEMQAVARKVRWTPELAGGVPEALAEIEKQLKIHYLVTLLSR